jgi:hypothetical protein
MTKSYEVPQNIKFREPTPISRTTDARQPKRRDDQKLARLVNELNTPRTKLHLVEKAFAGARGIMRWEMHLRFHLVHGGLHGMQDPP